MFCSGPAGLPGPGRSITGGTRCRFRAAGGKFPLRRCGRRRPVRRPRRCASGCAARGTASPHRRNLRSGTIWLCRFRARSPASHIPATAAASAAAASRKRSGRAFPATKAAVQSKVHRSDAKKSRRSKRVNSSVSPKIFQILPADHTSRCSPERSYLPRWSIFSRLKYFVPCTLRSIYETMK